MNSSDKYKLELNAYASFGDEEKCDLCANHFYGKFLNYIEEGDYVGASLAKKFLQRGDWFCSQNGYKDNKFNNFYKQAYGNDNFKKIKTEFFHDGMGQREREMETTLS